MVVLVSEGCVSLQAIYGLQILKPCLLMKHWVSDCLEEGEFCVCFEPPFEEGKIPFWTLLWPLKGFPEIIPVTTNKLKLEKSSTFSRWWFHKMLQGLLLPGTNFSQPSVEWQPRSVKWPVSGTQSWRDICCLAVAYCVKSVFFFLGGGGWRVFFFCLIVNVLNLKDTQIH